MYGVLWYYIVLYGTLFFFIQLYDSVLYSVVLYGNVWYSLVQQVYLGTVQYFIVLSKCYSMVLYGTACYFMLLFDIVCYCILSVLFIEAVSPATCTMLMAPSPSDTQSVHWLYLSPNVRLQQEKLTCEIRDVFYKHNNNHCQSAIGYA